MQMTRITKAKALRIQADHVSFYVGVYGEWVREAVAVETHADRLDDGEHDVVEVNRHIPCGGFIEQIIIARHMRVHGTPPPILHVEAGTGSRHYEFDLTEQQHRLLMVLCAQQGIVRGAAVFSGFSADVYLGLQKALERAGTAAARER